MVDPGGLDLRPRRAVASATLEYEDSIMSKVSKFLNKPGLFLADAVRNWDTRIRVHYLGQGATRRRAENGTQLRASNETEGRPQVYFARKYFPGSETLDINAGLNEAAILEVLRRNAGVFTTRLEGDVILGNCLRADVPRVLFFALEAAAHLRCELRLKAGNRRADLLRHSFTKAVASAAAARNFALIFQIPELPVVKVTVRVWDRQSEDDTVVSRSNSPYLKRVKADVLEALVEAGNGCVDLTKLYERPIDAHHAFPIDAVYTWVNHADPGWQELIRPYLEEHPIDPDRYHASDELRYSLRSLNNHAPWFRNIYVVSNCAPPAWLVTGERVKWVAHEAVFPSGPDYLPTFNSHAIEACLVNIDGLSEQFVYFNDDVFLARGVGPDSFFKSNGVAVSCLENYGMVQGSPSPERPDYLNAAIQGRMLIEQRFGRSPTQLHEHAPHALVKSVLRDMEADFHQDLDRVRRSRFRSITDISVVSFLFHHYAYQIRASVRETRPNLLIRRENFRRATRQVIQNVAIKTFCINDGAGSSLDDRFNHDKEAFLRDFFPHPAPWEDAARG
jgi:hypothetical protein